MAEELPRTTSRLLQFESGTAIGISTRWERGQYCSILTRAGIVGCGIYDLKTPAEFGQFWPRGFEVPAGYSRRQPEFRSG